MKNCHFLTWIRFFWLIAPVHFVTRIADQNAVSISNMDVLFPLLTASYNLPGFLESDGPAPVPLLLIPGVWVLRGRGGVATWGGPPTPDCWCWCEAAAAREEPDEVTGVKLLAVSALALLVCMMCGECMAGLCVIPVVSIDQPQPTIKNTCRQIVEKRRRQLNT